MNITKTLSYLENLKKNNNREWFQENKQQYSSLKKEFDLFIDELIAGIRNIDSGIGMITAKDVVFRIYRDIRFSKDKTPYKTHFGAYIANGGRKSIEAGYYFHLEPGETFIAGGMYMPPGEVLKTVRKEIYYNLEEFTQILNAPGFRNYFSGLSEYGKLVKAPRDFPADFPGIDFLKHKSYLVVHKIPEKIISGDHLTAYLLEVVRAMVPFTAFLNRAFESRGS